MSIESYNGENETPQEIVNDEIKSEGKKGILSGKFGNMVRSAVVGASLLAGGEGVSEARDLVNNDVEASEQESSMKKLEEAINSAVVPMERHDYTDFLNGKSITIITSERAIKWSAPMIKRLQMIGMNVTYSIDNSNVDPVNPAPPALNYNVNEHEVAIAIRSATVFSARVNLDSTASLIEPTLVIK